MPSQTFFVQKKSFNLKWHFSFLTLTTLITSFAAVLACLYAAFAAPFAISLVFAFKAFEFLS